MHPSRSEPSPAARIETLLTETAAAAEKECLVWKNKTEDDLQKAAPAPSLHVGDVNYFLHLQNTYSLQHQAKPQETLCISTLQNTHIT